MFITVALLIVYMAFKPENNDFTKRVFQPILFEIKRYVPVLRAESQPVGVAGSLLKYFVINRIFKAVEKKNKPDGQIPNHSNNSSLEMVIGEQIEAYKKVPDAGLVL